MEPSRLKQLFGKGKEGERERDWLKEAEGLLASLLVASNAARVASPLVLFAWLSRLAPRIVEDWRGAAICFVGSAACVLLFSEGVPRAVVNSRRGATMRFAIVPLLLLNIIFLPARLALQRSTRLLGKLLRRGGEGLTLWPLRNARATVWDAEGRESQLEDDEKVLISSIFDMTETIIREVMVPRVDMHCLEENRTLGQVRHQVLQTGHSRFPVYAGKMDNIVGLFLTKDILKYSSEEELAKVRVKDVMHPITFVPETKNVSDLLREFQQTRQHMAVVVDEFGSTAGLVTIEDLLEEIVGEIEDEFDHEQKLFVETQDGGYIADAKMSIGDVAEELNIQLPDNSEYDTIGGFVVTTLGKVPRQGETFQSNGVAVTVLEADDRRVHRVKLVPLSEKEKGSDEERGGEA
jgi:CBS domain containing-hemolysin-like protein